MVLKLVLITIKCVAAAVYFVVVSPQSVFAHP